ncbi:MAG TPA: helicase-exonuclease AddAB subunit AddA [Candidatus Pelethocola excrementipullorum]|nr:helicase-exonuclease AddAB subunit AddA [Candidatus Pelethocola excrementipullorum]
MAVAWTEEQQKVIDLRKRNILVSAAAGSGKTAVLVERILSMVTDEKYPIDIDSLLVVTFTRAAAAEMKERIREALEEALGENPENEHLQRQSALIHHAQITTIHGFCTYVIQNYFHLIDLDPVYRIADEGELKLLKNEVLEEILEAAYEESEPDFLTFVEWYAPGKSDSGIEKLILKLYEFAVSYPFPEEWLEECLDAYKSESREDIQNAGWMKELMEEIHTQLVNALEVTRQNQALAATEGGPYMYLPMLESDEELIQSLLDMEDYDEICMALRKPAFQTLSRKRDGSVDENLKSQVKALRDDVKGMLGDIGKKCCPKTIGQILEELSGCRGPVGELIRLTGQFMQVYSDKKRKKNLMDFSDLEHFALKILVEKEGDDCVRTEAAKELASRFFEVMIDEYQDSNYIQEFLLDAVSKVQDGTNNRFMVGDVKQSIYGFRLARPELFLEKQDRYSLEDGREQRVDLHKNFRSRANVLDSVNYIFGQIMERELGGIEYDEREALYVGADYPEGENPGFPATEVLLIDSKSPEFEDNKTRQQMIETEALAVAQNIRSMMGQEQVWDKSLKAYRPIEYRDCVVLLRTVSEWADIFSRVLQSQGIPAYTTSRTGYFSAIEVVTILNYLSICDNPRQEIPFAAVLHSPIGRCSAEELAKVKSEYPKLEIYEACTIYAQEGKEEGLQAKLNGFLNQLRNIRQRVSYTPIHQLITEILEETGYGNYAASMPAGQQREANLHMLVEKAVDFEGTSYRGLFNFIRYIEQIQKYEVDFGEVNIHGEAANTVRIMSIHKSKGLEFPVVYVAGMGKKFNFMDANGAVVLHSQLGIGSDVIDCERRTKDPSLIKQVIRQRMVKETLGEELRVLYVALTRAKEKLILTGSGDLKKWVESCGYLIYDERMHLYYGRLAGAKCYMDWVIPALAGHRGFDPVYEMFQLERPRRNSLYENQAELKIHVITPANLLETEMLSQMDRVVKKQELLNWDVELVRDAKTQELLEERFSYKYPHEELAAIPVKMTVSELKRAGEEEPGEELYYTPDMVPLIPKFVKGEETVLEGAARGTVYHKVMECLDYSRLINSLDEPTMELKGQLQEMISQEKLSEEDAKCLDMQDLIQFLDSELGRRMCVAGANGKLVREQPFVMGIPAKEVHENWPEQEMVLVQGIIDAFFEEEGQLVIVDYKTDRVPDGTGQCLVDKYAKQLLYYRRALQQITGKTVKEMAIYSITLGKEIMI